MGAIAVVGTGNGTEAIKDGRVITVSTAKGNTGFVYDGLLKWEEKEIDVSSVQRTKTKVMLILAHPDEAFGYSLLPNDGVGLMRMEFIIGNSIGIHPMALKHFDTINNAEVERKIGKITGQFNNKEEFLFKTCRSHRENGRGILSERGDCSDE